MTRSAATNAGVKQQFADFMTGFTDETTPGSAAKTPDYREHLCSGMVVYITFRPGSDFDDNIAVAKRLKAEGFLPVPHFAERSGAELYVVTQFCFEAEPVIAWDRRIQAEGNRLPIYIGVPGLATIKTLLAHAKACGIGLPDPPGPQRSQADERLRARRPGERAGRIQGDRSRLRHCRGAYVTARRAAPLGQVELCGHRRGVHHELGRQGF